jgi:hypothetical protein
MAYEHKGDFHVCNHLRGRNFSLQAECITTSASVLQLTKSSTSNFFFQGDAEGQIVNLPDATDCLEIGFEFRFFNDSEKTITIRDCDLNVLGELLPGASCKFYLKDNSTKAGKWLQNDTQLSKILVDTTNISGVSGEDAQTFLENYLAIAGLPVKMETPSGFRNCDNLHYDIAYEAIPGTIQVKLDGRDLTPVLDYTEDMDYKGFTILLDPSDSNRLNSPPNEREDLIVDYCRRVIF